MCRVLLRTLLPLAAAALGSTVGGLGFAAAALAPSALAAQASPAGAPTAAVRGPGSLPPRPPVEGVHFSARHDFRVDTVAMFDHPWSLAWLPNGDLLVVERPGRLRVVRDGRLLPEPVAGVPKVYRERGQGGLMDVLPHPRFAENHFVYLAYAKTVRDTLGANAIARGRLEGGALVDVKDIYVSPAAHPRNNQWGGKMAFDSSGYLYLAVGDRQFPPQLMEKHPAQDLTSGFGTIVRLKDDGSVPGDNPFVARADVAHEVWSWGHRNPQGLALDPRTQELWETEHGPRGGDELNRVQPGRDYGWPVVSFGVDYDGKPFTKETRRAGMESPVWTWIPSIAPSGLAFYEGDRFPWWKGSLFAGGLEGQVLVRLTLEGGEVRSAETLLLGEVGRIRDVRAGPDGLLYLAVDPQGNAPTPVVRLSPVQGDVLPPPR